MKIAYISLTCLALLAARAEAGDPFRIEEVADGVFAALADPKGAGMVIGGNAAFIVGAEDVLVVDTHLSLKAARWLVGEIEKRSDRPVRQIVYTQWENNRIQGTQAYLEAYPGPIEIIAHHNTYEDIIAKAVPKFARNLTQEGEHIRMMEKGLAAGVGPGGRALTEEQKAILRDQAIPQSKAMLAELREIEIQLPTRTFAKSMVLRKPGRTIELLHFGKARTRGDVVVYLPDDKVLVAGALVFAGPGAFKDEVYPGGWAKALAAIGRLDFDMIIPYQNAVLRGKRWPRFQQAIYASLSNQVRKGVEEGLALDEIRERVDLEAFRAEAIAGDARMAERFDEWVLGKGVDRAYRELTE